ncbi:hypothetical protein MKEN_01410800 [Mycena kentingensis (nom. inval.)]|nr:hypothetical protein MKEN_01410800 [Mycena kentingensis (nom. inval.)]
MEDAGRPIRSTRLRKVDGGEVGAEPSRISAKAKGKAKAVEPVEITTRRRGTRLEGLANDERDGLDPGLILSRNSHRARQSQNKFESNSPHESTSFLRKTRASTIFKPPEEAPVAGPSRIRVQPPSPIKQRPPKAADVSPRKIVVKRAFAHPKSISAPVGTKGKEKAARAAQAESISVGRIRLQRLESSRPLEKRGADAFNSELPPPPQKKRKLVDSRDDSPMSSLTSLSERSSRRQSVINLPQSPPGSPVIRIKRVRPPVNNSPRHLRSQNHLPLLRTRGAFASSCAARPPRFLSNPQQRPPDPQFDHSLRAFLASYVDIDDAPYPTDKATARELALAQAKIWAQVEVRKRAGNWFGSDVLDSIRMKESASGSGSATPRGLDADVEVGIDAPPRDPWAAVVNAIERGGRKRAFKARKTHGQFVAAQVASRIQGHWAAEAVKQQKDLVSEERRLRGVAKMVGKLVLAEWRKAVFHIREQHRLQEEKEELKRGHEHLDAILDQSGHILTTQHGDLTRGQGASRSRSGSLSILGHWDRSDGDEDDDDDEEEEGDGSEVEEDAQVDSEAVSQIGETEVDDRLSEGPNVSSAALLGDVLVQQPTIGDVSAVQTRTPSPVLSLPDKAPMDVVLDSEAADGIGRDAADSSFLEEDEEIEEKPDSEIPAYLRPYAVAPVDWDPTKRVTPPLLLRGNLRPYQYSGLEWLASLHVNNLNGILADEMGLGKTIQTIALLAHLACDRGIWGPHLIVVPTSVLLNWEMEFKKFLPGFRILSYHGNTKRRKELRQGWNEKHRFNVCITSYTLASRDAIVFKRKPWYYLILDEAHMIKNFKSQRWSTLLMFRSFRRLLLTGTPLQNNLTELWSLLQFLMSGSDFVNLKEFGDWFSNPLEKAIEAGNIEDEDTLQRVTKLHTVLRPYLLRRLKRDVEKELPSKYEHLVLCPLSKRQRFLYDEFMSRRHTREALKSGVYHQIANILMQLRKVCNHPDLFEVRPIVTSFAMERSAVADFGIKELLERPCLLLAKRGYLTRHRVSRISPMYLALRRRRIRALSPAFERIRLTSSEWQRLRAGLISPTLTLSVVTRLRYTASSCYGLFRNSATRPSFLLRNVPTPLYFDTADSVNAMVKSYADRANDMASTIDRFAFCTPAVVALDIPRHALAGAFLPPTISEPALDAVLHRATVKLQIAFPDRSLIQYDCGKLQCLAELLRAKHAGGHRVLIFTQMTRILDILEIFLNLHGYLYLRLDGATRIEDRQYITERFNADERVFCFIASSRSGGVGINLTGADTVVFYDSDFNPQMDRQCEDRAHRIGQIRDVHIYRFVSAHTVEEAMLRKANQKRWLDDLVIQKGEFDWRSLFSFEDGEDGRGMVATALTRALAEFDDTEDAHAAVVAAREEVVRDGQDEAEFLEPEREAPAPAMKQATSPVVEGQGGEGEEEEEEGGSIADYMIAFVTREAEFFRDWKV